MKGADSSQLRSILRYQLSAPRKLAFRPGWDAPLAYAVWISFYLLFSALVLGAMWGTGRSLPIAGGGVPAQAWQERTTLGIMAVGSFGCLGALALVLIQWQWQ
jgi:hypothetical protein